MLVKYQKAVIAGIVIGLTVFALRYLGLGDREAFVLSMVVVIAEAFAVVYLVERYQKKGQTVADPE